MSSFGADLKREREAKGISLKEISDRTKIGVRLLKALEDEQFEQLPGGIFDKSFLRQYARFLGMDEEHLLDEYMKTTGAALEVPGRGDTAASAEAPYRTYGSGAPSGSLESSTKTFLGDTALGSSIEDYRQRNFWQLIFLIACVLAAVALAIYGIHGYMERRAHAKSEQSELDLQAKESASQPAPPQMDTQPTPETTAGSSTAGSPVDSFGAGASSTSAGTTASVSAAPAGQGSEAAPAKVPPPPTTAGGSAVTKAPLSDPNSSLPPQPAPKPAPKMPVSPVPAASEPPRDESAAGQNEATLVLQIDARKECWVSVSADGQKQWQGVMRAAATRRVEAHGSVSLTLGDSGAVALVLNGKPLAFTGRTGEVKTLNITSKGVTQPTPNSVTQPAQ